MPNKVQGSKDRGRRHRGTKAEVKGSRLIIPSVFACGYAGHALLLPSAYPFYYFPGGDNTNMDGEKVTSAMYLSISSIKPTPSSFEITSFKGT